MFLLGEERLLKALIWLPLAAFIVAVTTRFITGLQYHHALRQVQHAVSKGHGGVVRPPVLPYWIPLIGNAWLMMRRWPGGQFWISLLARHPRDTGVCSLYVGGKCFHLLWNIPAINAMFKNRANVNKGDFDRDLWLKAFAMSPTDYEHMEARHQDLHDLQSKLLMRRNSVDELTGLYIDCLTKELAAQPDGPREVLLWTFLRKTMFAASVDTSFGTKLRKEFYPDMIRDFDQYDMEMPAFYYGLPRFMAPSMFANRERILQQMGAWGDSNQGLQPESVADAEQESAWDSDLGSRFNRTKRAALIQAGVSRRALASMDMAFVMGLSANVIRTTGWMMLNIIGGSDATLLPRVKQEVARAQIPDSRSLDLNILFASPLLQSLWTEALRCHIENFTPRNVIRSTDLPMDEFGRSFLRVNPGDLVFAANFPTQIDPTVWGEDGFHAERFITADAEGKESFQWVDKTGKLFPFGGGPGKCPGRIFAKQEAIATIALLFTHFDIEKTGMVDADGDPTDRFPVPAPMISGGGAHLPEGDVRVKISKRP